ncbi:AlpA family transcriptional regulator [Pseudomonas sp.]|uniref:AlpA family transcriptional regulator n=1 Tax=Pseudomonas sp. TaxID=306 RepID=UPI003CC6680B
MKLIRLSEVIDRTGLARATIYKYMAEGDFPASVSLGGRSVGWVDEEIDVWIKSKVAARDRAQRPSYQ